MLLMGGDGRFRLVGSVEHYSNIWLADTMFSQSRSSDGRRDDGVQSAMLV